MKREHCPTIVISKPHKLLSKYTIGNKILIINVLLQMMSHMIFDRNKKLPHILASVSCTHCGVVINPILDSSEYQGDLLRVTAGKWWSSLILWFQILLSSPLFTIDFYMKEERSLQRFYCFHNRCFRNYLKLLCQFGTITSNITLFHSHDFNHFSSVIATDYIPKK